MEDQNEERRLEQLQMLREHPAVLAVGLSKLLVLDHFESALVCTIMHNYCGFLQYELDKTQSLLGSIPIDHRRALELDSEYDSTSMEMIEAARIILMSLDYAPIYDGDASKSRSFTVKNADTGAFLSKHLELGEALSIAGASASCGSNTMICLGDVILWKSKNNEEDNSNAREETSN